MALPISEVQSAKVEIAGEQVEVRGMTRAQVHRCRALGEDNLLQVESLAVALSTGTPEPEALEWVSAAPSGDVQKILETAYRLSGMGEEEGKASSAH